jgi:hypothetical protein
MSFYIFTKKKRVRLRNTRAPHMTTKPKRPPLRTPIHQSPSPERRLLYTVYYKIYTINLTSPPLSNTEISDIFTIS